MPCVVAPCPTELSQVQQSFHEFLVSWAPPSNGSFSYEVFYKSSTGSSQSVMAGNADNVNLTGLVIAETYIVTAVSLGAEFVLPSAHCETITIIASKCCIVMGFKHKTSVYLNKLITH